MGGPLPPLLESVTTCPTSGVDPPFLIRDKTSIIRCRGSSRVRRLLLHMSSTIVTSLFCIFAGGIVLWDRRPVAVPVPERPACPRCPKCVCAPCPQEKGPISDQQEVACPAVECRPTDCVDTQSLRQGFEEVKEACFSWGWGALAGLIWAVIATIGWLWKAIRSFVDCCLRLCHSSRSRRRVYDEDSDDASSGSTRASSRAHSRATPRSARTAEALALLSGPGPVAPVYVPRR